MSEVYRSLGDLVEGLVDSILEDALFEELDKVFEGKKKSSYRLPSVPIRLFNIDKGAKEVAILLDPYYADYTTSIRYG